jgi:hypothetical protein
MKIFSENQKLLLNKLRSVLNEVTMSRGSSGSYAVPMSSGMRLFDDKQLGPFTVPTSPFVNSELAYDSYDGEISDNDEEIDDKEIKSRKISIYNKEHPEDNDDEGAVLNNNPINEDLGVWFGTKKKPKGSKQPKGPWVNICKKVDGKHPPCGRSDADTKSYPKCRAAGVAGKMSDAEKRSACNQKRRAEKKDPKYGKGNKPTMVSHKSKNESIERLITRIIREELSKNY